MLGVWRSHVSRMSIYTVSATAFQPHIQLIFRYFASLSQAYNMFFFPKFASKELMRHTDSSLVNIQQAVDFLYSDEVVNVDPQELNAKLTADIDTSATLLRQASWEITHQSANTKDLRAMVEALDRLRIMLSTCILDRCAYRMLKGETASMLREPVRNCHRGESQCISSRVFYLN